MLRDRNALYRTAVDGSVENGYGLKIVNKQHTPRRLRISLADDTPLRLRSSAVVEVPAESVYSSAVTVAADAGAVHGRREFQFLVEDLDRPGPLRVRSAFFGPTP